MVLMLKVGEITSVLGGCTREVDAALMDGADVLGEGVAVITLLRSSFRNFSSILYRFGELRRQYGEKCARNAAREAEKPSDGPRISS